MHARLLATDYTEYAVLFQKSSKHRNIVQNHSPGHPINLTNNFNLPTNREESNQTVMVAYVIMIVLSCSVSHVTVVHNNILICCVETKKNVKALYFEAMCNDELKKCYIYKHVFCHDD